MKSFIKYPLALLLITNLVSCSSDDTPEQINEEELITQVILEVTETGTTNTMTYTWEEGSGSSGVIALESGKTYDVEVGFVNNSDLSNIIDITEEVIEEADEHQVFYETASTELTITPAGDDFKDTEGNELGIKTTWTAMSADEDAVVVYLIHEPVSKTGTTRGDLGGETDVEVSFDFTVN